MSEVTKLLNIITAQEKRIAELERQCDDADRERISAESKVEALREELSPLEGRKVIDHVKYTDSLERKVLEQKAEAAALREALKEASSELSNHHTALTEAAAEVKAFAADRAELYVENKVLRELLLLIRDDLRMRAEDGIVDISDFIWMRLEKALLEKGDE